jgi:hypothetical protein
MNCSAFSWNWDSRILWYSWKWVWQNNVSGTSVSVASSFINFIEKKENSNFILLDKQKKFTSVEVINDNWYTKKTDFKLKLKFSNNNIWLKK